jgi:hypothetical protein
MKRMIVIVLVLLLVAGGGAGGLIMLGIVPNPFTPKIPEKPMTAAERAAAELKQKNQFKPPAAAYKLVKMDDMVVPVIIDGSVRKKVVIVARVVTVTGDDEKFVQAGMKRLSDRVLSDLVPFLQTYYTKTDSIDAQLIKDRFVKHAKDIFGERAKDVLLVNVFDQNNGRPPNPR